MKARHFLSAGMAAILLIAASAYAAEGDKPDAKGTTETKNTRLIKPFSELKDLSPDQTEKLKVIHRKYLDEVKVLEAKQHDDFMAVLTDAQKKEVAEIETADKAGKKTPAKGKMKDDAGATK